MSDTNAWPFGDLAPGAYGVILADPPWQFRTWSKRSNGRPAPYETMDMDEIAALPVSSLAATDCLLCLWTTAPFLAESIRVLDAWGFRYTTAGVWAKTDSGGGLAVGTGYYWRSSAEMWLVGTRGQPGRVRGMAIPNAIIARRQEHSRKPGRLHADLERMYPTARKCELFSRQRRDGWDCFGHEVDRFTPAAGAA